MQDLVAPALATLGLIALAGYLVGSIPFGLFITRAGGAGDIRTIGSGNIGATNVLRTGRKGLAIATLTLDVLKGALPVWLGAWLGNIVFVALGLGLLARRAASLGPFAFLATRLRCYRIWQKFPSESASRPMSDTGTFFAKRRMALWPTCSLL